MGLTPPLFFLNNVKKTAELEKRNIPDDDHCRWTAPSEASTVKMVATVVKVCFYILMMGQVLSHKISCRLGQSSGWSWNPLRLRWPLAYSTDTWAFLKIIPSYICQTAVQQKCQVTASNGNGNNDGSDEGGSIEPSSSTSVSMTSFLLIASIIVLSI